MGSASVADVGLSQSKTTGVTAAIDDAARAGDAQQTISFSVKYANFLKCTKDA
jgi:hypothetical protein